MPQQRLERRQLLVPHLCFELGEELAGVVEEHVGDPAGVDAVTVRVGEVLDAAVARELDVPVVELAGRRGARAEPGPVVERRRDGRAARCAAPGREKGPHGLAVGDSVVRGGGGHQAAAREAVELDLKQVAGGTVGGRVEEEEVRGGFEGENIR